AVTHTNEGHITSPRTAGYLTADVTSATPGDPVGFTIEVTNTGTALRFLSNDVYVNNTGSTPFTVGGGAAALEYQALPSGEWTPFARCRWDGAGNLIPETTLFQFPLEMVDRTGTGVTFPPPSANRVVGTVIAPGGSADWFWANAEFVLPADIGAIVFDPAQSAGVRTVFSFDTPSGTPQT